MNCIRCDHPHPPVRKEMMIKVADNKHKRISSGCKVKLISAIVVACDNCDRLDYNSNEVKELIRIYRRIYGSG